MKCLFCEETYELRVYADDHQKMIEGGLKCFGNVKTFGLELSGSSIWKIYVCSGCGHVAHFRPDLIKKTIRIV